VAAVNPEALRGHIDTMVLAALSAGAAHGYALVRQLAEQSDGVFTLGEGTVYPALHRLEKDKLVASRWTKHDGRRRRVYRLTTAGEASLVERRGDWRVFAGGMNALLDGTA
jgi:PadR family transcriptional regulator, regulatory protein PadR